METELTVTPGTLSSELGVFCRDDTHPALTDCVSQYLKELGRAYRERIKAHPPMQADPSDPKLGRPLTGAEVQALTSNIGTAAFRLMRGGRC